MLDKISFSIIMPTYNSEKTIEKALRSVRMQDLPQEEIEILVIDGGSTDATISIAQRYEAVILDNPDKLPEYAKRIGFEQARGRWIVMLDSDEVLTSKSQLRCRKQLFEDNPNLHCIMLDKYVPGENCGIACTYATWVGDPFNYIIYGVASQSKVEKNKRYLEKETVHGNIYRYKKEDIIPIGDGGSTTIDIQKAKQIFGEEYYSQEFAASAFGRMVMETGCAGCIPDDKLIHYSRTQLKSYLKKLRFRVYANLHDIKQSGYSNRAEGNSILQKKKYLYVIYTLSIIAPLVDSIRMVIKYRKPSMVLHFAYTYWVAFCIVYELCKKILHQEHKVESYGK